MAGHAQLKFVMTECSKTQIRLTGLILFWWFLGKNRYSRLYNAKLKDFSFLHKPLFILVQKIVLINFPLEYLFKKIV